MLHLLLFFVSYLSVGNCLHVANSGTAVKSPSEQQFSCAAGSQQIPLIFQCDGVSDCQDGSDESDASCLGAKSDQFNEPYYMIHPDGYKLPDKIRYKAYWDTYKPKFADLPYAGKSVDSVEIYYLQAPMWHDNSLQLNAFQSWLLQQIMRSLSFIHAGAGLLFRDNQGQELSRISMQFWSGVIEIPSNPNLLPINNTIMYDKSGRLLVSGRSVLTYARSRGNWESGYWTDALHLKTMNVETYHQKLPWINKYLVDHEQFTWISMQDTSGNVIMPKVDCDRFAREMMKEFTGVDVVYYPSEDVIYFLPNVEVEVIEQNVDSHRVQELLDEGKFKGLATMQDAGAAAWMKAMQVELCNGGYFGPFHRFFLDCENLSWKVDPGNFLVSPVSYKADLSPIDVAEFVSHVNIVRPTGRFVMSEVTTGMKMQFTRVSRLTVLITFLTIFWCVFKCLRAAPTKNTP